ncbi:SpoIIE family protein phosphatase [Pelagicoccus sp. SDUM812003]|uniref:PP2C family protein-serine/threonine phosphatase n=1 Tax=Pelagicoccus sp. SDUM812003 TaxID=3041267 RepID=UPI00280FD3D4|nr:SpoIIE family protein phosphatase [Pelagicoccus sp. SDUM812003]MDQ8202904.1 SpoIIE family protein phosphatase [Pelagicoccus sp. SDUM812003]
MRLASKLSAIGTDLLGVEQAIHSTPTLTSIAQHYEAMHRDLPIASLWKDRCRRVRGCNKRLLSLLGLPPCERDQHPVGSAEEALFSGPLNCQIELDDSRVLATGEPALDREVEAILPDGRSANLIVSRIPLQGHDQKPAGILVTYLDVTEHRESERRILAHEKELEERNKTIEFDLDSARQIQKFLLGKRAEPCAFLDVAFRYRYMEKVGGDYMSFRNLDGDAYSLLLADLTGHGVTAALFMALLKYISQEAPEEVRALPGYFLNYLDMEFYGQIPNGFFTAISATARYDESTESVELEYANAAHPAGVIVRKDGSYELLENGDFAVGLLDLVERSSHKAQLRPGDRFYAYTDGFLETVNDRDEEYGMQRFCETLAATRGLSLENSIEAVYAALAAFSRSDDAQDDMTILGIEARAKESQLPSQDEDPWGGWGDN